MEKETLSKHITTISYFKYIPADKVKEAVKKLKRAFCLEYEQSIDECNLVKGCENCKIINKIFGDKLV